MEAILALQDGSIYKGESFGAAGEAAGEVVFNTGMTGYQEIVSDPSYKGQLVTMTYPLIGNYGINDDDFESARPWVEGFIVKELSGLVSNYRAGGSLGDLLKKHSVVGIQGLDTRSLTRHIRQAGALKGVISSVDLDEKSLVQKALDSPGLIGRDLVKEVTCSKSYQWPADKDSKEETDELGVEKDSSIRSYRVVALDFGIKSNILRNLTRCGCRITVMPAATGAEDILALAPDGVFLSNGPGDPAGVPYVVETVKKLLGKLPIFGICLGHQILGLAFGGRTYKLKFGHHGANQPVMNLTTGRVEITAQNHGFSVDIDSIPDKNIKLTHLNLNDKTVEGLEHTKLPVFSVQYHPEAAPGPHDSAYLFDKFIGTLEKAKNS